MNDKIKSDLIFVGYTNGYQILNAKPENGGEGSIYSDTAGDSYIPIYMLRSHAHRIETTSDMNITLDMIEEKEAES